MSARILVVDDDAICRELERAFLEQLGYEVIEAADGVTALAMLRAERVDLLSTGIILGPPMDGIELARRAREQNPNLKVLFVSGDLRVERLEPKDRDRFVPKPYRIQQLAEAVAAALADSGRALKDAPWPISSRP
jgi:CheY-like chemotaxis protein